MTKKIKPIHPGTILKEEFLVPMKLSQSQLSKGLNVSARRINEILQAKRAITADTALRLAKYFRMSAEFWLGLQMDYELAVESDKKHKEISLSVGLYKPMAA